MENQAHCDFVKLRNMLIRTHMHDLKDVTCDVHYENYRAHCIQQMTRCAALTPDRIMRPTTPSLLSLTKGWSLLPTQTCSWPGLPDSSLRPPGILSSQSQWELRGGGPS